MSVLSVQSPFPIFTDTDGDPLESGYIWIGVANLDPQVNPLAVYWDAALTMPAVQPIRTLAGYPSQAGSPGRIYTNADHSIRVQNKRGTTVFTAGNVRDRFSADLISFTAPDGNSYPLSNLSDSSNVAYGDAFIAVKQPITGAVGRTQHSKNLDTVSILDFGAVGDGSTNNSAAFTAALISGVSELIIPEGTYNLDTELSVTLTDNICIKGTGKIIYSGNYNTLPLISISTNGFSCKISGIELDGNSKCCGGIKIDNNSDTYANCILEYCYIHDFFMNSAALWNQGFLIRGLFDLVTIKGNIIENIKRAAGTGASGASGTNGGSVTASFGSVSRFIKKCVHIGNVYKNIFGGDLVGSADNIDYDGFSFFCPDPTNFNNSDSSLKCYPDSTLTSKGNKYINCRGRAIKIQGLAVIEDETIERNSDYTIFGGSIEINLQWGIGTVKNCQFIYRDYLVSSVVTSPIQTSLTLVSIYQGTQYGIDNAGASVSGIRVYNSIKTGTGINITNVMVARGGATTATTNKPIITLSDVSVNRGNVDFIITIDISTGYALYTLRDISIPILTYAAVGIAPSSGTNSEIIAQNVYNMDGVVTPGNAKKWFLNYATFANVSWIGRLTGYANRGFLENFNYGSAFEVCPVLDGAGLAARNGVYGAAATTQCLFLADDATGAYLARGYTANAGILLVTTNNAHTEKAVIATNGTGLYSIAADAGNLFALSTVGANPDTDGRLNMWISGGVINVKNRLGGSRLISILFLG